MKRICGVKVYRDESGGQNHCWRRVEPENISCEVVQEIEGAVRGYQTGDGERRVDMRQMSDGQYYRWLP